jgi:CubicO group peptidase (beta-lactamase class C family)
MEGDLGAVLDRDFSGAVLQRAAGRRTLIAKGWADLHEQVSITVSTRFNTASLTKLLTAVAVCRLVERGTLGLRQSLSELLPESGIPRATGIRIEHLLTHTAGLPEEAPDDVEDDVVGDQWIAAARTPLLFEPGTGWAYSNIGYGVLGAVIEWTSGRSFADVVEELVLEPAGMTETRLREARPDRSAIGYENGGDERDVDDRLAGDWRPVASVGRPKAYGYGWSTVEDLERLVDAVASGALIGPELRSRILHGQVETGQPGRRAGFGMFHESVGGRSISTLAGAGPGISAWLDAVAEPDAGYVAIVLSNRPKPAAHAVGDRLRLLHMGPGPHSPLASSRLGAGSGGTAHA